MIVLMFMQFIAMIVIMFIQFVVMLMFSSDATCTCANTEFVVMHDCVNISPICVSYPVSVLHFYLTKCQYILAVINIWCVM